MRMLILIFIVCFLQASSCRREKGACSANTDDRLTIVNHSTENITFQFSYYYPDDSLYLDKLTPNELTVNANPAHNVAPNSSKKYRANDCWEYMFSTYVKSGKLRVLIFNTDSVKAHPPAEIISRGLYTSYLYTLDELKALDWQVVYP